MNSTPVDLGVLTFIMDSHNKICLFFSRQGIEYHRFQQPSYYNSWGRPWSLDLLPRLPKWWDCSSTPLCIVEIVSFDQQLPIEVLDVDVPRYDLSSKAKVELSYSAFGSTMQLTHKRNQFRMWLLIRLTRNMCWLLPLPWCHFVCYDWHAWKML